MTIKSWWAAKNFGLGPATHKDVCVERNIETPMRDGVSLFGDRFYSRSSPHQSLILIRSPYGRSSGFSMSARLFAERGFQVFLQSCRGTSGSGGSFNPVRQESEDGLDTLAWLEQETWCSGTIYTFGLSYLGFTQFALCEGAGQRLGGMGLHCTLSNYRDHILEFDAFALEGALKWGTMMAHMTSGSKLALLMSMLKPISSQVFNHLPLNEMDSLVTGREVTWWQDWIAHPESADPWWEKINFTKALPAIEAPVTMIGGWHDIFLPSQVRDFEILQAAGRDVWLTIGPWHHTSKKGAHEAFRQSLSLFSACAAKEQPFQDRDRVRLYIMGANEWRDFAAWPPPDAREECFYFRADDKLSIQSEVMESATSSYIFDPADPTPAFHAPSPFKVSRKKPKMDLLEERNDTLVFTSSPLQQDYDVVGPVQLDLYFRSSSQYTDVYACLCDVDANGVSLKVSDGYLRLYPGRPLEDQHGVRQVEVVCWPTAYRYNSGHRLRVIIASGAHPRYARNLGTGQAPGEGTQMLKQSQEIYHDTRYPSALKIRTLPV